MALYDNRHWLLSHIRNSFISSDDTGISEMVMLGEDIPRKLSSLSKFDCYPGINESDEEDELDAMGQSFDLESDMDYGVMRQRSNTAQRLEKMDQERKKAGRIKHIKWESSPITLSDQERAELFQRKNFKQEKRKEDKETKQSLLSEQLEKCPHMPQNPFVEYAKYDGSAQVGTPTRKYGIFLTMLEGPEKNYPMHVVVVASAKVQDLIGLICWKYTMEHGLHKLKDSVEYYGLFIAEDDGEVDWDFPCIDPRETVGKFGFTYLALVEVQKKEESEAKSDSKECELESWSILPDQGAKAKAQQQDWEDQILMKGHMTAMEAPLYQSYRVYILNKVRTKTEIHLGISGEKVEIDPVIQQKVSAKFWNRQKAVSYDMDNIAACDLIDAKSSNRSTFRLVYHHAGPSSSSDQQGDSSHQPTYKHHDFEAERHVAEEIVQKVNHILELRSSVRRKEYLALRERKSHRKRSFHLGPR